MKKIFNILYSTRLMAVLFVAFATAMGVATFVRMIMDPKQRKH